MRWFKENIKEIVVAVLFLIAVRLPHGIGWTFWLPKANMPLYFTAIDYTLTCIFAFVLVLYLAWWILRKR